MCPELVVSAIAALAGGRRASRVWPQFKEVEGLSAIAKGLSRPPRQDVETYVIVPASCWRGPPPEHDPRRRCTRQRRC
jgi:hypothetical protein